VGGRSARWRRRRHAEGRDRRTEPRFLGPDEVQENISVGIGLKTKVIGGREKSEKICAFFENFHPNFHFLFSTKKPGHSCIENADLTGKTENWKISLF